MKTGMIEVMMSLKKDGTYISLVCDSSDIVIEEIWMMCYYKFEDVKVLNGPAVHPKIEITSLQLYDSGEKIEEDKYSKKELEDYLRYDIEVNEMFDEYEDDPNAWYNA